MDLHGLMERIVGGCYTSEDMSAFMNEYPHGAVIDMPGYSVQGYLTTLHVIAQYDWLIANAA